MSSIAEKINRSRESTEEVAGFTFTIRRPTNVEAETLGKVDVVEFLKRYVVDWNLKEIDLIPGGSPVHVPFDVEDFAAWVGDHPDVYVPLSEKIITLFLDFRKSITAAVKN